MDKITLDQSNPEIAKQWHPTKNAGLTPKDVTPGRGRIIWWVCSVNSEHEWPTRVNARVNGRGCPYCGGKKKFGYEYKILGEAFPDLVEEWHPTKNAGLTPFDVTEGSAQQVWWQCKTNPTHEWPAKVQYRTRGKGKCPYCNNRIPSETTSLAARYPNLAKQWHPTKNGDLTPDNVFPSSDEMVWWQCTKNATHVWQAKIKSRVSSKGNCKFCILEDFPKLPSLAEHDPELAKEWHPTKNNDLTPDDVTAGSSKKVWWLCKNNPSHVWPAAVGNRTRGKGCPICAGMIPGENSFAVLHPELAKEWHPTKNNSLTPKDVTSGSSKMVWWLCSNDSSHEWKARIFSRTKGEGKCPKCSGMEKKYFADIYPETAKEWHPDKNGNVSPKNVPYSSAQKYWWKCSKNPEHEWLATPQNRGLNQSGCPQCHQEKAGRELSEYLVDSATTNTEFYKNFLLGIENIDRLTKIKINDDETRQTFLRLLFANTITLMETYLSDAFTATVLKDKNLIRAFVETNPYFAEIKTNVSKLYEWAERIDKDVAEYLQESVVYHNIWKVRSMYGSVLEITFPDDLENLQRAIMSCHDIVHRNGKSKKGTPIILSKKDVRETAELVRQFVTYIDKQFKKTLHS